MKQAITADVVVAAAADILGSAPTEVVELAPRGTLRSFRCASKTPLTLRVDEDPGSQRVDVEALAFVALRSATVPAIVPEIRRRHVLHGRDGIERRFLAYDWIAGQTLAAPVSSARARELGQVFAQLHGARVMDLWGSLPANPMSLLDVFRRAGEQLKTWLAQREAEGLGPDLLTLAVSDLQRALRPWVVTQDNLFKVRRRRSLCHGAPEPAFVVAQAERSVVGHPFQLVGLDRAFLGDAAFDLASFARMADLDDDAEDALLLSYVETLDALDRTDGSFLSRYFAARLVERLARPAERLERIARIKRGEAPVIDDPVVVLEQECEQASLELAQAMNDLRDLVGRTRPVSVAEVRAMGRVTTLEEMLLAGRSFRLAVTGQPYTGKTEVGAAIARRLGHLFFGTAALSRALALVQREAEPSHSRSARTLVAALFNRGFCMEPVGEPPYYRASLDGHDITERLRDGADTELMVAAGALLDDDDIRAALREALERRFVGRGVVVEGLFSDRMASGRWRAFHLVGDAGVRQARLMSHRKDVDENTATTLLSRLDAESPRAPSDATLIDVGSRPAAAAALDVLNRLLPTGRRSVADLSGRAPM
jgi:hypothetical protein